MRVDGSKGYHDAVRHPEGHAVPGLVLYRFDAPLFFANAEVFHDEVSALCSHGSDVRRVVVTAEPITDIDATAAEMLRRLHEELTERGVVLAFAELKGHVRERLSHDGLVERTGPDRFFPTIGEAVRSYVTEEAVPWTDWEDRPWGPAAE